MRKAFKKLAALLILAGVLFTSCQSPDKKTENARENLQDARVKVDEAKKALNQARNDSIQHFRSESYAIIISYERGITDLKAKIAAGKAENKVKYEKTLANLEQKNNEMKLKLAGYKDDGQDKWQSFQREFTHDMAEVGKAFKDLTVKNTN